MISTQVSRATAVARPVLGFVILLLILQYCAPLAGIPAYVLPLPSSIAARFVETFSVQVDGLMMTAFTTLAGLGLALVFGVLLALAVIYVPLLRSTFARFGVPARFYFDSNLEEHAVIRFLGGALEAMLSGWDHAATLSALRLAPRFADLNSMDRFDFKVRGQIPDSGLETLRALAEENESIERLIASFAEIEEWRALALTARGWAARFPTLRNLFKPARC